MKRSHATTSPSHFGLDRLDQLLAPSSPRAVVYLQGNPGTGRDSFAIHFANSCNGQGDILWIGIHASTPNLPPAQNDWWNEAQEKGRLHVHEIDSITTSPARLTSELRQLINAQTFARAIVFNADLLALTGDQTLCLSLIQMLRRSIPLSLLVGTLPHIGGELDLTPPAFVALADCLLATRIALPAGSGLKLDVIKSPSPDHGLPPTLHYEVDDEGVKFLPSPVPADHAESNGAMHSPIITPRKYVVMPEMFYMDSDEERLLANRLDEINAVHSDKQFVMPDSRSSTSIDYNNRIEEFKLGRRQWDFFVVDAYRLEEMVDRNLIWPLGEWLTEEWRAKYLPVALDQCTIDGQIWGLPHWINPGVMLYRPDLLARHGMKPPTLSSDLVEQSLFLQKREKNSDFSGCVFAGAQFEALTCTFLEFLWNTGGEVYDAALRPTLTEAAGTDALRFMVDLIHRHGVAPNITPDLNEAQTTSIFLDGGAAFVRNWPQVLARRDGAAALRNGRIAVAPFPTTSPEMSPTSILGGFCYVIPRHVKSPETLMRFYMDFYSADTISELAVRAWACSPFKSVYTDKHVLRLRPWYAQMSDLLNASQTRKSIPHYRDLTRLVRREVNLALRQMKSPEEALSAIVTELQHGLARQERGMRLQKVLDHIRNHLHEDITRDNMAALVRLSPSYFSTLFSETVGCSFARYVNERRIERARQLLETSELTIAEVAERVGYTDHSYFCHVFRETTQMPPTQYRLQALSRTSHH